MKKIFRGFTAILLTSAFVTFYWITRFGNNERHLKSVPKHQFLVYNKVSKCGSTSLITIMKTISQRDGKNFTVTQHPAAIDTKTFKKKLSKEQLAKESSIVAALPRPVIYARHVYYIDFGELGLKKPMYINMIRDPVDRFVSNFYFDQVGSFAQNRSSSRLTQNINDCVLQRHPRCSSSYYWRLYIARYFCGQDEACGVDQRETVEMAKRNIENDYVFIGITEEFENSLRLFEKILPNFFDGALDAWFTQQSNLLHRYKTTQKEQISNKARSLLEEKMWADYEIYRFVQERFQKTKLLYGVL